MTSKQFSKTRHISNMRLNMVVHHDIERLVCIAAIPRDETGSYVRVMREPDFYKQIKVIYRKHRKFFMRNPMADVVLGD